MEEDGIQKLAKKILLSLEFAQESGPAMLRNCLLAFSLMVLHFAVFVSTFDPTLSVLLDTSAMSRFLFSGAFLYSILFALVLVVISLSLGREVSPVELIPDRVLSALGSSGALLIISKNSGRVFTHVLSSAVFVLVYLGIDGAVGLAQFLAALFAVFFLGSVFRSVFKHLIPVSKLDTAREAWAKIVGVYFAVVMISVSAVAGHLRAVYVSKSYEFQISMPEMDESNNGSIFLTSGAGIFVRYSESRSIEFISWERQPEIVTISSRRDAENIISIMMKNLSLSFTE